MAATKIMRLEEIYSYTRKKSTKKDKENKTKQNKTKQNKTKQRKTMCSEQLYYTIIILALNKSIQVVQLIY